MFKKHLKLKSIITSDAHILQKDNTQYQAMAMAMG
jgi:hypothetical protein